MTSKDSNMPNDGNQALLDTQSEVIDASSKFTLLKVPAGRPNSGTVGKLK